MDRPGNKEIQFALHANYGSNVDHYAGTPIFVSISRLHSSCGAGAISYLPPPVPRRIERDLKQVELHMLDAGHFALETNSPD